MKISAPFSISSRLMSALNLGDCTLSLEPLRDRSCDGRAQCAMHFDFKDGESISVDDMRSGVGASPTIGQWFETALSFLGACAESRSYAERTGRRGDNADLFPERVGEWAQTHSDEIGMLAIELQEDESAFFA